MAAGVGAGIYDSIVHTSEDLVVWEKEYLPNSINFAKYMSIREKWQEAYESQLNLVDRGLTQSMWKAPGV